MFEVQDMRISITQGDTGLLTLTTSSDHVFTDADRAVFTVRRENGGAPVMEAVLTPDEEGTVQVELTNAQTGGMKPGRYEWDVRYVLDAVWSGGRVTGGSEVITPMRPGALNVLKAVGSI